MLGLLEARCSGGVRATGANQVIIVCGSPRMRVAELKATPIRIQPDPLLPSEFIPELWQGDLQGHVLNGIGTNCYDERTKAGAHCFQDLQLTR